MKKIFCLLIILIIFGAASSYAIPYAESQPLIQKIKINENIRNLINFMPLVDGLIIIILGILLLIPSLILLTTGLVFLSMPMPMKVGGLVFALIGLIASILSLVIISIGFNQRVSQEF